MSERFRRPAIRLGRLAVLPLLVLLISTASGDEPAAPPEKPTTGKADSTGDKSAKKTSRPTRKESRAPSSSGSKPRSNKVDMSPVPPDKKAEKKDLRRLGEKFKLRQTAHYSILYDTSEEDVKLFAAAIERTYRSCMNYTQRLGFDAHPPKHKLLIYYFEEHGDYSKFSVKLGKGQREQSNPGVFFPDMNRSMFYNFRNQESYRQLREQAEQRIAQLREQLNQPGSNRRQIAQEIAQARRLANFSNVQGGDQNEATIQHEVAHQVLWNIGFHNPDNFFANPRWLAEGTAMLFEPVSTGKSANFGALNKERLKEFQELVRQNQLIPLRDFISTHGYFGPQTISIAYPQSWALTHYLNRMKKDKVRDYAELINKRPKDFETTPEKEIADFEKVFGKVDDKWVQSWLNWMKTVR